MVVSKHLTHFCYPIRLVLHQHLNSHVAYPGIPPENSNHTRGQHDVTSDFSNHIRVNFLRVWALAGIIEAIYHFSVRLFRKILIGYSQLYTPDENKQV